MKSAFGPEAVPSPAPLVRQSSALPYRSDRVFRSAERLLAAPPRQRPFPRPPRWLLVATAMGLAVALGVMRWNRRSDSQASTASGPWYYTPIDFFRAAAPQASQSVSTPAAPAPSDDDTPAIASPTVATSRPDPTIPPARDLPATAVPFAGDSRATPLTLDAIRRWTTTPLERVALRGELRSASGVPLGLELLLWRSDDARTKSVQGIAKYRQGETYVAATLLEGTLEGDLVRLRETDFIWRKGTDFPLGRQFLLQLPAPTGKPEILGTWLLPSARGTLVLDGTLRW